MRGLLYGDIAVYLCRRSYIVNQSLKPPSVVVWNAYEHIIFVA